MTELTITEMCGGVDRLLDLLRQADRDPEELLASRIPRLEEEVVEVKLAHLEGNTAKLTHEALDVVFVALGVVRALSLPSEAITALWREIVEKNASKVVSPGVRKLQKPLGFEPVDPEAVLAPWLTRPNGLGRS